MKRKVLGWIELNDRSLKLLMVGAHVHFAPEVLNLAGWSTDWKNMTMTVKVAVRYEDGATMLTVDPPWMSPYCVLNLDASGRYLYAPGVHSLVAPSTAKNCCVALLPLFVDENGQSLCPFCGQSTRYHRGADYCDRPGHGVLPDHREAGLVKQYGWKIAPTWLEQGKRRLTTVSDADTGSIPTVKAKPSEGDMCLSCRRDRYVWTAGALKCPSCWHRP